MTTLTAQRRIAARALKCGRNRVYFDPFMSTEINGLINSGVIKKRYKKGVSRARAKAIHEQKKKGRRSGPGSRKGEAGSRTDPKETWINHIRLIRAFLKNLRDKEIIDTKVYQKYYALSKGGSFRNVGQLKRYMQDKGILKKEKAKK